MVSFNAIEGRNMMSGSEESKAELVSTHNAEITGRGLHCAFQSQASDGLRPVSSTHYLADIQQCGVFDGDQDNGKLIGTEFVVSEKIFRMLPEDEKLLWHSHNVEVEHDSLSSSGNQQVADTYGRLVRSLENNNETPLPPALSQLLMSSSGPGSESLELPSLENEAAEDTRPGYKQAESGDDIAPHHRELDNNKEDDYLNDAVHRPVVHHRPSHLPALTEPLPDDRQFLSETRSTRF